LPNKDSWFSLFSSLPVPIKASNNESFSAQAVEELSSYKLGKDVHCRPAVLISPSDPEKSDIPYPIVLENISIRYDVHCQVTCIGQQDKLGRFIVIRCESNDSDLVEYFLRTMEVHIKSIELSPSFSQVASMVDKLVELFRALSQPSKKSIQGLWAELLIIAESSDPKLLLQAWHAKPDDRYDFYAGKQCIEVKSSSEQSRIHHFSLEQLNPPGDMKVIVASILVHRSNDGFSVVDIMDKLRSHLCEDYDLLAHLHQNVAVTLGSDWRQASFIKFDKQYSEQSIKIYNASSIPSVSCPVPLEVSDVRFKSNVSRIIPLNSKSLIDEGGLYSTIAHLGSENKY